MNYPTGFHCQSVCSAQSAESARALPEIQSFAVAFNDVDFCVRVREAGYTNVFTLLAQLYHYESKSRGLDENLGQAQAPTGGGALPEAVGKAAGRRRPLHEPEL